ncbi:conserved hypothetical protein [Methylobacterium sp. 4-46]|uniref:hypothetical protein n=1 Tax=unclassified Methylobacterium TaxID=2615210 RepID=UPI000152D1EC|nr:MULTISPECIES: hypothetical protein [Methylobacterium]ACA18858.1 conserved hypothetical protein [Methylobacterium sp. 4-46]WFT78083.1 hypothetical protein QA634_22665 [Methylobacterium nodulans]
MRGAFDHILRWRLLPGSHAFPGPDGGTCINEAAMVAAGLPYRAIRSSADCPPCFSRPLASYALGLNDAMPDAERPRLMAFVLRLAGSADTVAVEAARTHHLTVQTVRRLLPPVLEQVGLDRHAAACRAAADLAGAVPAARAGAWAAGAVADAAARGGIWVRGARAAAACRAATFAAEIDARSAADAAEAAALFSPDSWAEAVAILDEALGIGRQAPALPVEVARDRMAAARAGAV